MTVVALLTDLSARAQSILSHQVSFPTAMHAFALRSVQQPSSDAQPISATCFAAQETARAGGLECGDYTIRMADSPQRRKDANELIRRRYAARGYRIGKDVAVRSNPNRITLQACAGERTVGTLTVGLDSDERLLADALYGDIIDPFRGAGRKVCELSQFAVDSRYGSKELLASLFRLAYICGRVIHEAADAFIEVNPRHVRFYQHMFGFRQLGELRTCPRVGAPAVLLHSDLDDMDARLRGRAAHCIYMKNCPYLAFLGVRNLKSPAECRAAAGGSAGDKNPAEAGLGIRQFRSGEVVIS